MPLPENCPECGETKFYKKSKGPHLGLYCFFCDKWIAWVPRSIKDFVWPIGTKHKGKKIEKILKTDPDYLRWAAENLQGRLKTVAENTLKNPEKTTSSNITTQKQSVSETPQNASECTSEEEDDLPW